MPSKRQKKILKELMLLSSCVYNSANYLIRHQFFNGEKIFGFYQLQQQLQNTGDYQLLGRSYALPRIQVYAETNNARFKLIKSRTQKRVGLPKYLKNRKTNTTIPSFLTIDNCQYSINKDYAIIPLSRKFRKRYGIKHFRIRYNGILKWQGKQKRGQVRFKDGQFYLHQSVEVNDKKQIKPKAVAGLDLGIKKIFAVFVNGGNDWLCGSKRFFRQWKHWTDLIAKEQSKLSLINHKSSKNLQRLFRKRSRWQDNLFNNLVAKLFRFLYRNQVSCLIVGDIKNILKDDSKGKRLNQMTHNYWSFDKLLKKIQNKCEEFGIGLKMETEEYTSRTCPICGDSSKSNCKDRIFVCGDCGFFDHRDIVGARNILIKSMYGSSQSIHWGETAPLEAIL